MYKYTFSDEDSEKINKKTTLTENLLTNYKDVDEKYMNSQREFEKQSLNLEKLDYNKPTELEVKTTAQNSLNEYKTSTLDKIETDYNANANKLDNDIKNEKATLNERKAELEILYGSLKKQASDDAVKRGLARSSIIVNKLEAFDKSMLDSYLKLDNEFHEKFSALNSEKSLLEVQKQSALSAFDIAYAIKLEDKISKLNTEIMENEQKVIKYNNEIAEKEAEFDAQQEELKNKIIREDRQDKTNLIEFLAKEGVVAYDDLKAREKYEYTYEVLKSMPKNEALSELENNVDYRKHLGRYYDKLLSLFS